MCETAWTSRPRPAIPISRPASPAGVQTSVGGYFSQYRPLLPHAPFVGLEFPAGKFVALVCNLVGLRGAPYRWVTGFQRRRLCRAFAQALNLCRAVGSQISVSRFVAYRGNHVSPTRGLCSRFSRAAFETTPEPEFGPSLREFIPATTERHYRDLSGAAGILIIRSISSIVTP